MKSILIAFCILFCFRGNAQVKYMERLIPAAGDRAGFVVYYPEDFEKGETHPVLFVLHGIGERGNGSVTALKKLAEHDNYTAAEVFGGQYGFIIIEPQTSSNWEYGEIVEAYLWLKDSLPQNINWKKIALTGTSLGGGGVYHYLSIDTAAHNMFSAAVPMGSGSHEYFVQDKNVLSVINTKVPVWAFHNRGDTIARPSQSTLFFYEKWRELNGTANMWVSIYDLNSHTFPAYNRGRGNTLSDGLSFVTGNGYISMPACNLYEWILMQEIGKPAVAP